MSVDIVKKNRVGSKKYRSMKKSGNKIVKISTKSKSGNLLKSRSENLSKSKKVQNASVIEKCIFLILNVKIAFTKLN